MNDTVDFSRCEVEEAGKDWQRIRDVIAGERAVKEAKFKYLPMINPQDKSDENEARNAQYIARAYFFNGTGRTLEGLLGIAFAQPPEVQLPSSMEVIEDDVDGSGGTLDNQSQRAVEETVAIGRCGLLVDYPPVEQAVSQADLTEANIHSMIVQYKAEQIINWRIGKDRRPELIVLYETHETEGEFCTDGEDQFRELRMVDGVYQVRIWRNVEGEDGKASGLQIVEEYTPTDGWGIPFDHITFYFIGSMDNDAEIDKSPLIDLTNANLSHYRSSANHFDAEFYVNQPQYWVIGADAQWMEEMQKAGIYFGSRAIGSVPAGGNVVLLQPAPNTMAKGSMDMIKADMVSLGARLLTPGEAVKTTDQAKADIASSNSILSLACVNVSNAYTRALEDAALYMRVESDEISFTISTEFMGLSFDPASLEKLVAAWQGGSIPNSDHWRNMRQLGVIDPMKSDDEIEKELEDEAGPELDPLAPTDPVLDPAAAAADPAPAPIEGAPEE